MDDDKILVFSHGPWLFEETGQRFTGDQLDAAAFAKYRAALAERDELRAQVEALRVDAERYQLARSDCRFDIRIVGIGKRSGSELDAALDAAREAQNATKVTRVP